ncbi:hypothetical protein OPV22_030422 [Ensete ventricosum]|uniref:Uncharacterized protein n=1 Tax=Ensete ventricosum TaxID=4639 RepID=A0AAV8QFW5_ENSVE|nr:hypothetical protein OPV22_030422 [Ensete ventricosum]
MMSTTNLRCPQPSLREWQGGSSCADGHAVLMKGITPKKAFIQNLKGFAIASTRSIQHMNLPSNFGKSVLWH